MENQKILQSTMIPTPIGEMLAIANEGGIYLLEFTQHPHIEKKVERLLKQLKSKVISGRNSVLDRLEMQLSSYFDGQLIQFKIPIIFTGTPFQHFAWDALKEIPYAQTKSYAEQAESVGNPSAYRAIANANGANRLAIIVPCHRVINSNGCLGGYGGGVEKKQWLLDHEKKSTSRRLHRRDG